VGDWLGWVEPNGQLLTNSSSPPDSLMGRFGLREREIREFDSSFFVDGPPHFACGNILLHPSLPSTLKYRNPPDTRKSSFTPCSYIRRLFLVQSPRK
jgi:hypothetical protein